MAAAREMVMPPASALGPAGWLKAKLFNTWYNSLLTVLMVTALFLVLKPTLIWVFSAADWSPITSNLKLFLVGQYPLDQMWRVGVSVLIFSAVFGVAWGVWGGVARNFALLIAIGLGALAFVPLSFENLGLEARLWIIANPVAVALGYQVRRTPLMRSGAASSRWVVIWALASFVLVLVLLRGISWVPWLPQVSTGAWGGLLLTFLLALVGILASFPLGVLLALGRRSDLPVVKGLCVLFIELVRCFPLVSLLFMTQVIVPLFLPEELRVDRVLRALFAITLFSSAYMAENIRGGLQAVPRGQVEAARALGMNGFHSMFFIVLPQALRAVIPALAGQFISLFKDTSLVVTVGLLDVLGIGKSIVLGNVEWVGSQREVYIFIALLFWVFTYSMSYASRRLESALGVGQR